MSAIPCLSYRRALEEEKKLKESVENENAEEVNKESVEKTEKTAEESNSTSGCPYANGNSSNGNEEAVTTEKTTNATTPNEANKNECDDKPPPAKRPRVFGAFSNAKIETVKENLKEQSLTVQQISEYCKNLFIFKNIRVMRFT